ncbi:MAG: helix-turn-helix transcriptional regulator, partial [Paludibacteraceae bacterium]|nr:helix-turn-helix transcriptional regulator [Paludibacteraceae bacterium]
MTKTKDVLIEVARQLFAEKGKENTTMNDIALESKKGRRTIYTYFSTKEEIFLSVIERELRDLLDALVTVEKKNIPADEKLKEYIFVRLDKFKEIIER